MIVDNSYFSIIVPKYLYYAQLSMREVGHFLNIFFLHCCKIETIETIHNSFLQGH
jgi:hypothetical protein